jgi:hypothetical protein
VGQTLWRENSQEEGEEEVTFIVKGKAEPAPDKSYKPATDRRYMDSNPEYRKAFHETMERVKRMDPKELAPVRRMTIKAMRFQGKTPALVGKCAAIRAAMTEEINR